MRPLAAVFATIILATGSAASAVSPWLLFFDCGSARLDAQSKRVLDNVAMTFRNGGIKSFKIHGHSDRVGSTSYNLQLSGQRAAAVRAALVTRGISAHLLETEESGEERPLVETPDGEPEAQNRRVEIVITCMTNSEPGFEYMRCGD